MKHSEMLAGPDRWVGVQVWDYAHGRDHRQVEAPQARKSIGAQVYYGVRLDTEADADKFLDDLAGQRAAHLVVMLGAFSLCHHV